MAKRPREIAYTDELLADGTVHRRYDEGRSEWRTRAPDGSVRWRDDRGGSGTDEPLGDRLVKRTHDEGRVEYGRDIGYGRTVWDGGARVTVNRAAAATGPGARLRAGRGPGALGPGLLPPTRLTPDEEERLRRKYRAEERGERGERGVGGVGAVLVVDAWTGTSDADWSEDFG
ncbi:hypothetical protein [Streptomyces radicis]|nr:hypothetical protein [Streptomyces radicis]